MSSFRVRSATRADAASVVEIVSAFEEALLGTSDFTLADLHEEWRRQPPERDAFVVEDGETTVGYGTVGDTRIDGYVHPSHFGRGVGALLVTSLEHEIAARGATLVQNATLLKDERAHALLRAHGYREVRRFWIMRTELAEAPPPPVWPGGVTVETLDPGDAESFHDAYEDAFADHWGHSRRSFADWRRDHLEAADYAPELWRVVRADGRIVAGAFGSWERYGVAEVARLFTRRAWRRRGLGEAMLLDLFGVFWRGGKRVIGLAVDATSETGADRLYRRVGMHVHWGAVVFEKALA